MKQTLVTTFIFVQISKMTSDNLSLFLTLLNCPMSEHRQSAYSWNKPCSATGSRGLVPPSTQGVGGAASHAATGTGQPVCAQVPRPVLKSARCITLPVFKREGSIVNMRNYSLDTRNQNKKTESKAVPLYKV